MSLLYEKRDHIAYLTLNRPEAHNAVDPETVLELVAAWEDYRDDEDLRCIILTGTGNESFCAGADLAKLIPLFTGARQPETDADRKIQADPAISMRAFLRDFDLFKPVVAAVNGNAIAGGFELLYAADIRVASENARFGLQEVKWAIFPAGGSTVRLPRQIPYAHAMEMLLTGELIDAGQALQWGFVNRVVPQDRLMEAAQQYAEIIVKNGPLAIQNVKRAVLETIGMPLKDGLNREMELAIPVFLSRDAQEGPRAFKEKRTPVFKGA
ncbi:MAG: Enoyl-CoA hydratase (EC 4.2.1.17) [Olavius algarvensis Delta 4 endosymbiont]|nr:MAG: Enoyl-CoA hydratase (EC 4.2.1.17) [Olavius algarvensis Delta 4 endosymbiont]